ncbi:MAG: ECF transporter S component [Eubacteriaceae bacterium]
MKVQERRTAPVLSTAESETIGKTNPVILSAPRKRLRDNRPSKKKIILTILTMVLISIGCVWICFTYLGSSKYYSSVFMVFVVWLIGRQSLTPQVDTGPPVMAPKSKKASKRMIVASLMILVLIPIFIWIGIRYLGDRRYYIVSMLIIVCTMLPFMMVFEGKKPQARELIIIAVLAAIGVAGRAAFFMLPQFKPVVAIVIISGICFGGEAGFLVGAVTGFVSNFFFGQGPWTPWQMFAFGIIGFLSGVLFMKGWLSTRKNVLCIYGGLVTLCIYGPIMNAASLFMWSQDITWAGLLSMLITGFPFDLVHALATVFFLSVFSQPMIEKLERIKKKYGMIELN